VNTTDLETAAESLLFDPTIEAEEAEVTQEDAPEVEETEIVEEDDQEEDDNSADDVEYELDESNDEDDAAEQSDGDEKPQSYNVKVDGVDTAVTLDDLTRSYSGQAYIQKGMQETAEGRKQFQTDIAAFQADQQRFSDAVQKLQTNGLIAQPQRPDQTMLDTDPIGYMRAQAQYDVEVADYTAQQAQLSETTNRTREYQEQQSQAEMQKQAARFVELIPELADPIKGPAIRERMLKVGVEKYQFSKEELNLTDARVGEVLYDAMRWQELQSGTAAAKTTPKPQKSVKPTGRRSQPKSVVRDKQLAKARKSGSSEDFMALMFEQNQ
jgi:hypothetical protein